MDSLRAFAVDPLISKELNPSVRPSLFSELLRAFGRCVRPCSAVGCSLFTAALPHCVVGHTDGWEIAAVENDLPSESHVRTSLRPNT